MKQQTALSFPALDNPDRTLWLNLDPNQPHILCQPANPVLLGFLADFETQYINDFWQKALLVESPYTKGVPYGLSCSAAGHSVVPTRDIAKILDLDMVNGHLMTKKIHALGFDRMCSGLRELQPNTIAAAMQMMTENGRMRLNAFSLLELASQSKSFAGLAQGLASIALSKSLHKRFAMSCLMAMRAEGWLLLPTAVVHKVGHLLKGIKMSGSKWVQHPIAYLNRDQALLLKQLEGPGPYSSGTESANAQVKARFAVLCSSISSVKEINWKFAKNILFSTGQRKREGANVTSSSKLRAHWRDLCQANGPAAMVGAFSQNYRECIQMRCPEDPRLSEWLNILEKACETQTSGNYEPRYQAYGYWCTYLVSLPVIPRPNEVTREHINDIRNPGANTFRAFLERLEIKQVKNLNKILMKIADVLDGVAANEALNGRTFYNPVNRKTDMFQLPRREPQQGTRRKRLQGWVLDELKNMIVTENRDASEVSFSWGKTLELIPVLWIHVPGEKHKVFCPILPAIIYFLLEYPLRSHHVRWLDSGELDPKTYDFTTQAFVKNFAYDGLRQSYGLLQPAKDGAPTESELPIDFQVAVNKVLLGERKTSNFTIPYVTKQTLWVIQEVLKWQLKYGALPKRVKEVYEPTKQKNRNQRLEDFYPDICPLFRYPLQASYFPPSSQQLNYFWGQLCAQWDHLNEHWREPKTGNIIRRPGAPILSKPYRDQWVVATHDIHSLRVAGVSFLLDAGFPLAVVASIAGHRSLAMTLHYYRADLGELRLKLKDAYAKMADTKTWEQLSMKLNEEYLTYEAWLKSTPDGFQALREARKTKIWNISLSGICPGTSCDDGLPKEFRSQCGRDVPGSRCALCRFFVSGPPFLPGLVHEFNCLLFDLEQKAHRQIHIRTEMEDAEEGGHYGRAQVLRGEDERLDRECHLDIKVLVQLHSLINECLDALNNRANSNADNPLALVCAQPETIRCKVEQIGPFQKLKELVDAAEWLPTSRQTAPDQAIIQLKDKLLYCLRVNGAPTFLAGLPPALSKKMTLWFANIIEELIPDTDQREKFISGQLLLKQIPAAAAAIDKAVLSLEAHATAVLAKGEGAKATNQLPK